jgi:hypothetical protein
MAQSTSSPLSTWPVPDHDLDQPPSPSTRLTIIEVFWDLSFPLPEAYWSYYYSTGIRALADSGKHVSARHHQDLIDAVALIKENESRQDIRNVLRARLRREHDNVLELLDKTIDLAAQLLLMIEFGHLQNGITARQAMVWGEVGSLRDCVAANLSMTAPLRYKGIKLQRTLNAQSLVRIAGLEILPTNNLLDHLRLIDNDTKLCVFYQASFLKGQTERYRATKISKDTSANTQSSLLPDNFVKDTINTLATDTLPMVV